MQDIFKALLEAAATVTEAANALPSKPGIYAWWITDKTALPGLSYETERGGWSLLYIGIAKDSLKARVYGKHIRGTLGNSTFRYSLAAILLEQRKWKPTWPKDRVLLTPEDNEDLTQWMRDKLRVGWVEWPNPIEVEEEVITALRPALNISKNAGHRSYTRVRDARVRLDQAARPVARDISHEANNLALLAKWIWMRNQADATIARIIGRPAEKGHIGEFVASRLFGLDLHDTATKAGSDGQFNTGVLTGKTANVKYYGKMEGLLDINPLALPDYYLVFTGPKSGALRSQFGVRPFAIDNVYLFEACGLVEHCQQRGVKVGVATSIPKAEWASAQLYPVAASPFAEELLKDDTREALDSFRSGQVS